jgi:hypothetical protein
MRDNTTESLTTLALGDPTIVPPAFAEVLDAVIALDSGPGPDGDTKTLDKIIAELTTDQMKIVRALGALAELHQAATNHQTFSKWIGTANARRILNTHRIAEIMDADGGGPAYARTYADFRDYIAQHHPTAIDALDRAWKCYQSEILAPYGDAGTIRIEAQYATRIAWDSGYEEIHPKTVDGVSRFDAERHAMDYTYVTDIADRRRDETDEPGSSASASVVRRTVVYSPWYTA